MIYTWGYRGRRIGDLLADAVARNATVIDVRFSPFTRAWGKDELVKTLGRRGYKWMREFGNKNYRGGPTALVDYDAGRQKIVEMLARKETPILLCSCGDWRECHRSQVAGRLEMDLGVQVEHLQTPKRLKQVGLW